MTKYVVVGDSQAEGLLFGVALPAILGDELVGRYDHRGWSSARMLSDGAIQTAAGRAVSEDATLLIFAGGNDNASTAENADRYRATLRDIVKTIARKSAAAGGQTIKVVWFGPVFARAPGDAVQHPQVRAVQRSALSPSSVRQAVAEVPGASVSWRWVDSFPLTRDLARVENVHLTADGYRIFAERVLHSVAGGGGSSLLMLGLAVGGGWWAWKKWGNKITGAKPRRRMRR